MNIAKADVSLMDSVKSLGVTIDSRLTFDKHVNNICQVAFHIRALRHVRVSMSTDIMKAVASAIVCALLDYCNSLLYGVSAASLHKLQRVQNNLARLIKGTENRDRITTVLQAINWLPVTSRITYKIAILTYKVKLIRRRRHRHRRCHRRRRHSRRCRRRRHHHHFYY